MPPPEASRPLRIGYLVKRFPRASETFIAREILELERLGAEVHVFSLRPNDDPLPHAFLRQLRAGVTVCEPVSFSEIRETLRAREAEGGAARRGARRALGLSVDIPAGRGRRYLREALSVARVAEARTIQHLHAHFANHPSSVAMLVHLMTGLPYSFTAHAKDIYAAAPPPAIWARQLRHAAFAVTVSDENLCYLKSWLGERAVAGLRRLYNGVELPPLPARDGSHRERTRIICVSRLVEKKGIDLLLEALSLLARAGASFEAILVGDGPLMESMAARSAGLGLDDRVRFTGAVPQQEVLDLLRESEMFVLPCRIASDGDRDALPTVLLEAMAAGLPCISTRVGGVPEIVREGETGLLVPPEDYRALAGALGRLLEDPALARSFGRAGRRRAEALFDAQRNVAELYGWIHDAVHRGPSAGRSRRSVESMGVY